MATKAVMLQYHRCFWSWPGPSALGEALWYAGCWRHHAGFSGQACCGMRCDRRPSGWQSCMQGWAGSRGYKGGGARLLHVPRWSSLEEACACSIHFLCRRWPARGMWPGCTAALRTHLSLVHSGRACRSDCKTPSLTCCQAVATLRHRYAMQASVPRLTLSSVERLLCHCLHGEPSPCPRPRC